MPNVVVQTMERLTMKAAAAAKTGRQRAASHNSGANNTATGPTVANSSDRRKMAKPLTSASAATVKAPSTSSLSGGRSREGRGKLDQQRRDRDYSEPIGRDPVLPGRQYRRRRAVKQLECDGPADPGHGGPHDRRHRQAQHVAQLAQPEIRTEVMPDQPCREHGFARIAQAEENGAPDIAVAERDWRRWSRPSCRQ